MGGRSRGRHIRRGDLPLLFTNSERALVRRSRIFDGGLPVPTLSSTSYLGIEAGTDAGGPVRRTPWEHRSWNVPTAIRAMDMKRPLFVLSDVDVVHSSFTLCLSSLLYPFLILHMSSTSQNNQPPGPNQAVQHSQAGPIASTSTAASQVWKTVVVLDIAADIS